MYAIYYQPLFKLGKSDNTNSTTVYLVSQYGWHFSKNSKKGQNVRTLPLFG